MEHNNCNKSIGKISHKRNKENTDLGRKTFIQELISKSEREQSNSQRDIKKQDQKKLLALYEGQKCLVPPS